MTSDRKTAIAAYKERKTIAGVFVIRCTASSQAWVGQTPNLEKIQNRIWFTLRQGSHTCRSLQAAWTAHGPDGLTFGECERLEAGVRSGPLQRDVRFPYHPHVTVAHDVAEPLLDRAFLDLASYDARVQVWGFSMFEKGKDGVWRPQRDFPFGAPLPGPVLSEG